VWSRIRNNRFVASRPQTSSQRPATSVLSILQLSRDVRLWDSKRTSDTAKNKKPWHRPGLSICLETGNHYLATTGCAQLSLKFRVAVAVCTFVVPKLQKAQPIVFPPLLIRLLMLLALNW
jgi:hypothetical protein